jgi:hypothetical protein
VKLGFQLFAFGLDFRKGDLLGSLRAFAHFYQGLDNKLRKIYIWDIKLLRY